jgi:hypothetical protein
VTSIDVYAITNPALCAAVLCSFVNGYIQVQSDGCLLPLCYVPIPLVLSSQRLDTFSGTNSRTGFLEWSVRNPDISLGMADAVQATTEFSKNAMLYGIRYGFLDVTRVGRVISNSEFEHIQLRAEGRVKESLAAARKLGVWLGNLPSTATVFHTLGFTI